MTNKIDIDLKGVPQTLLLPLLGRAKLSTLPYSPIQDQQAIQLVNSLNYDFEDLSNRVGTVTYFWMARAYHFDEAVKKFTREHPGAVIVNLGAGLETAFSRVDNGKLIWIDLDLPEVIALREKLLPPTIRQHYIGKSILDFSWMQDIKQIGDQFFFFAGGLFMYFSEEQVKSIITTMANEFPKSELAFDTISHKGMYHANKMLDASPMKGAQLTWALDNWTDLRNWSPKIEVVAAKTFFDHIKTHCNFPLTQRIKMHLYDWFDRSRILQLRFK